MKSQKAAVLPELEDSNNIYLDNFKDSCQVAIRYKIILLHINILIIHLVAVNGRQGYF
jgi:hypothetical protein